MQFPPLPLFLFWIRLRKEVFGCVAPQNLLFFTESLQSLLEFRVFIVLLLEGEVWNLEFLAQFLLPDMAYPLGVDFLLRGKSPDLGFVEEILKRLDLSGMLFVLVWTVEAAFIAVEEDIGLVAVLVVEHAVSLGSEVLGHPRLI